MFESQGLAEAAARAFPAILTHDFLRYVIGAGGVFLLVNMIGARALAGRRIRSRDIPKRQIVRELLASMRTVVVFACFGFCIWLGSELSVLRFYEDPAEYGWAWFAVSVIALIVLHDAWFYWTHRLIHHPRLFRRLHRTHHRSHNPTPFASYSFDIGEAALNAAFLLLAGALMPISLLASLIFVIHMMIRNAVGHCGYELFARTKSGRPLFDWMTTTTHHDLHHAEAGWNYGLYFTWWDRWMGTEHPDYHARFAQSVRKPASGTNSETRRKASASRAGVATLVLAVTAAVIGAGVDAARAQDAATAQAFAAIEGEWATQGYGAIVRLSACVDEADALCGTLLWTWEPIDQSASRDEMVWGARFSDGAWRGGRLRDPFEGRVYRGALRQISADMLELEGCALVFCRTQIWRRLASLPHVTGSFAIRETPRAGE